MSFEIKILNGTEKDVGDISKLFDLIWPSIEHYEKTKWAFGSDFKGDLISAIDNNNIVGMRGSIKWPLSITNTKLIVNQLHGTGVHPDYRRQKIFSKLNLKYINTFKGGGGDAIFNVSVLNSKLGYEKLGWIYNKGLIRLIKPIKPISSLIKLKGNVFKLRGEMVSFDSFEELTVFDEIEKYWMQYKKEIQDYLHTDYNNEFYNWRYSNKKAGYKYLKLENQGFCIYKIGERAGLRDILIGAIWSKKENIKNIINNLVKVEKPDFINIIISKSHPHYKEYKRNLFFEDPKGSLFLGVKSLTTNGEILLDSNKWAITTSDIDTF